MKSCFALFFALCSCFGFEVRFKNSFGLTSYKQTNFIVYRKLCLAFLILSMVGGVWVFVFGWVRVVGEIKNRTKLILGWVKAG